MTLLSLHFTLEELALSSTAVRLGIDNTPAAAVVEALKDLAVRLEAVRDLLGVPMHIDSGYRCLALNQAIHGSPASSHMTGEAADFIAPAYGSPLEVVRALAASPLAFDQLIQEGTWVHFGCGPQMRRQVLTATFVAGVAHYTAGA